MSETTETQTPAGQSVTIRHEFATPAAAAAAAAERAEEKVPKPERLRIHGSESDFRELSMADYVAQRQADEIEGIRKGVGRALKAMGLSKAQRNEYFKALLDEDNGFEAREGVDLRLIKKADLEAYEKVKGEYEGAKPQLAKVGAYEKAMLKIADNEMASLPEAARKRLEAKLGKDADAATRLTAIEEYKALIADLAPSASDTEKKDAADKAAAEAKAEAERKPNPATTGAPPGPSAPKGPGSLNELEVYEDLGRRGLVKAAGDYYLRNSKAIEAHRESRKK